MGVKELDSIALLKDMPAHDLEKGDVGTVVAVLDDHTVEVEFIDPSGSTKVLLPLTYRDYVRLNPETLAD